MKYFKMYLIVFSLIININLKAQEWKKIIQKQKQQQLLQTIEDRDKGVLLPIVEAPPNSRYQLIKLKNNSDILWERKYSFNDENFTFNKIKKIKGGYLLFGGSFFLDKDFGDPFMVKLNECFEPEWYKIFDVPNYNFIEDILELNDSTYLLQVPYLKGDADYSTFMSFNIEDNSINYHYTLDMHQGDFIVKNNELYISGESEAPHPTQQGFESAKETIFKTNIDGNIYWKKQYYPDDTVYLTYSMDICNHNENYMFALVYEGIPNKIDFDINEGIRIFKIDTSSNIVLNKLISDSTFKEAPAHILQLNPNKYIISSDFLPEKDKKYSFPKLYVVDSNLNIIKSALIDIESMGYDITANIRAYPDVLTITSDNHILIGGGFYNNLTNYDTYIIKLDSNLNIAQKGTDTFTYDFNCNKPVKDSTVKLPAPQIIPLNPDSFDLTPIAHSTMIVLSVKKDIEKSNLICYVYPNPTKDGLNISLPYAAEFSIKIQDINGKILKDEYTQPSIKQYKLDVSDLPQGIYILEIYEKNTQKRAVYKVVKE